MYNKIDTPTLHCKSPYMRILCITYVIKYSNNSDLFRNIWSHARQILISLQLTHAITYFACAWACASVSCKRHVIYKTCLFKRPEYIPFKICRYIVLSGLRGRKREPSFGGNIFALCRWAFNHGIHVFFYKKPVYKKLTTRIAKI